MANAFRLLGATGSFERRDLLSKDAPPRQHLRVEFSDRHADSTGQPWTTVIIGKNGVGKSRLLAGIADVFESLLNNSSRVRGDYISLRSVDYLTDGKRCTVHCDEAGHLLLEVDGKPSTVENQPLPSKIIALSTTPFDKFRVPRSILPTSSRELPPETERYAYLGLRDRTGRASTTAAIFRALEGLFEASRSVAERRFKIAEVFRFLGYEPHIEVRYEFSMPSRGRLESIAAGAPIDDLFNDDPTRYGLRPLERMLRSQPDILTQLNKIASQAMRRSTNGRSITLRADFEGYSDDDGFFRDLQLLRRADLLRMRAAEVVRISDGAVLDLKLASSGELGIVTGFLGLASVIEDGSLIFIDEPEISLHPEWQTQYIDLLLRTFGSYSGCHFVLATHSPLILSDITPEHANVVSLDPERRKAEDSDLFAGQSSDYLLAAAFKVPGKNNLFLKQEIVRALRLAADGEAGTKEFASIVRELEMLLPSLGESPTAQLIGDLSAAAKRSTKRK